MVIETRELTKQYGSFHALKRLTLDLEQGDVFGYIGPNGAGKTTTMRILATLLEPTYGEAYVCGHSIYRDSREIRRLIGYMPDFFGVYDDMKVIEYLEFFAAAYRIRGPLRRKRCEELLELVDLTVKKNELATSLSRGMTQRLGLARTLIHDPQVLLLDEPASGLDPHARLKMRDLLKTLRDQGKTIMVSSHILPELADICNKIGIIERGELAINDSLKGVVRRVRPQTTVIVQVVGDPNPAAERLSSHYNVEAVQVSDSQIKATLKPGIEDFSDLPGYLIDGGIRFTHFSQDEPNLEQVFRELTQSMLA